MFLGLNQELGEVRGSILGRKSALSIREVFSEVRREELRKKIMLQHSKGIKIKEAESSALAARGHEQEGERTKKPWCDQFREL